VAKNLATLPAVVPSAQHAERAAAAVARGSLGVGLPLIIGTTAMTKLSCTDTRAKVEAGLILSTHPANAILHYDAPNSVSSSHFLWVDFGSGDCTSLKIDR